MRKTLLALLAGAAALAALSTGVLSQVNTVPQVGVISGIVSKTTYRAVSIGLVPAASATDFFCISGSASKIIKVTGFRLQGTAGTLTSVPVVVLRRASLDTGGTAASTIANPANTIGKSDTNNPTATAVLIAYTANPTIVDASPTYMSAGYLTTPTVAAGTNTPITEFTFGANLPQFTQQLTLRGLTDQVCLNMQAGSISSGVLEITASWTEE